ncbi:MAG: transcriptional repressor [Lachnospiraceae bacterium]|nr:transcriptional repressor [Lachnospiraceae bacterium]
MMEKASYKTKQREELLEYLKTVPGVHVTAADVVEYFHKKGRVIGTSTVYRQLERMVDEGIVGKYSTGAGAPACFAYLAQACDPEGVCFHCKCEKCGRLIHLHCEELAQIGDHLLKEHAFVLDPMRTVFYGICEACRGGKENGSDQM